MTKNTNNQPIAQGNTLVQNPKVVEYFNPKAKKESSTKAIIQIALHRFYVSRTFFIMDPIIDQEGTIAQVRELLSHDVRAYEYASSISMLLRLIDNADIPDQDSDNLLHLSDFLINLEVHGYDDLGLSK